MARDFVKKKNLTKRNKNKIQNREFTIYNLKLIKNNTIKGENNK